MCPFSCGSPPSHALGTPGDSKSSLQPRPFVPAPDRSRHPTACPHGQPTIPPINPFLLPGPHTSDTWPHSLPPHSQRPEVQGNCPINSQHFLSGPGPLEVLPLCPIHPFCHGPSSGHCHLLPGSPHSTIKAGASSLAHLHPCPTKARVQIFDQITPLFKTTSCFQSPSEWITNSLACAKSPSGLGFCPLFWPRLLMVPHTALFWSVRTTPQHPRYAKIFPCYFPAYSSGPGLVAPLPGSFSDQLAWESHFCILITL